MALLFDVKRTADVEALSWLSVHILTRNSFRTVKQKYRQEAKNVEREIDLLRKENIMSLERSSQGIKGMQWIFPIKICSLVSSIDLTVSMNISTIPQISHQKLWMSMDTILMNPWYERRSIPALNSSFYLLVVLLALGDCSWVSSCSSRSNKNNNINTGVKNKLHCKRNKVSLESKVILWEISIIQSQRQQRTSNRV